MNKNPGEARAGEPQFEVPPLPEGYEASREKAMESGPAEETATGKQKPKQQIPVSTSLDPVAATPTAQPTDQTAATSQAPTADLSAHDLDRIEKQWIERAKRIVAHTQDDPYTQKKELNKAGADYIKKRFNKTIPTDDAVRT